MGLKSFKQRMLLCCVLISGLTVFGCSDNSSKSSGIKDDTTAPAVSETLPADNATGVAVNKAIAATFSEEMDETTIDETSFTLYAGTTRVSGTVEYSGLTAIFTPGEDLVHGILYTATITTGAKDIAGNALAGNTTWEFTINTDATAPGAVTVNTISLSDTKIGIIWTNPGDNDFDHVKITWSQNGTAIGTVNAGDGATTYTITGLTASKEYAITLAAADAAGNKTESDVLNVYTMRSGTASTDYYSFIYTAEELNDVRNDLGGHYLLMADIDLSTSSYSADWTTIGYPNSKFTGIFNGNNHVIKNLYINNLSRDGGLFLNTSGATICNLGLESVNVIGFSYVGSLTGVSENSTITDCYATGAIAVSSDIWVVAGGLMGYSYGSTITDCFVTASVTAGSNVTDGYAGGFVLLPQ